MQNLNMQDNRKTLMGKFLPCRVHTGLGETSGRSRVSPVRQRGPFRYPNDIGRISFQSP